MTTPTTPKPRKTYERPTKYPARLSTMLRQDQRDDIDARVEFRELTLGEVTRALLDDGLDLDKAYVVNDNLREDVERIAKSADVDIAVALGTLLRFAVSESDRRLERHNRVARIVAETPMRSGLSGMEVSLQ